MQGIGYVSRGLCLMYPRLIVSSRYLLGRSIGAMGSGVVLGSCRGGWSACPEVCLLYFRSVSLTIYSCRCAHGVQYGGLVTPPLYVLQCAALGGCLCGFPSVLALWCSQYLGGENFTRGGHCVGSVTIVLYNCMCAFGGRGMVGVELWWLRVVTFVEPSW